MFALLVSVLAAAPPADALRPVAIVSARDNPGSEAHAEAVIEVLSELFGSKRPVLAGRGALGLLVEAGEVDPRACAGQAVCFARLADKLHAEALVAVDVAEVRGTVAVFAEAFLPDGSRIASQEVVYSDGGPSTLRTELTSFSDKVIAALSAPGVVTAPVVEARVSERLAPSGDRHDTRTLGLALNGAGAVLLASGAICGLLARDAYLNAQTIADSGDPARRGELDEARLGVKRRMLAADVLYGAGALALGAGLYFTFATSQVDVALSPTAGGAALSVSGGF